MLKVLLSQFKNPFPRIQEYIRLDWKFYELITRNDIQETEEKVIVRYVDGLKIWIHDKMEAYQPTLKVEAKLYFDSETKFMNVHSFYPSSKGKSS